MRRVLAVVLASAGVLLAGCGTPPDPEVTFHAAGKTIVVAPMQYCDVLSENCTVRADAAGVLRVPPGKPVQISVPGEVADTVWRVVLYYRDASGQAQEGQSRMFTAGEQLAYTLNLPNRTDQLESVEIQQFGKRVEIDEQGAISFVARATWALTVDRS